MRCSPSCWPVVLVLTVHHSRLSSSLYCWPVVGGEGDTTVTSHLTTTGLASGHTLITPQLTSHISHTDRDNFPPNVHTGNTPTITTITTITTTVNITNTTKTTDSTVSAVTKKASYPEGGVVSCHQAISPCLGPRKLMISTTMMVR